jgi:hypothetical protein
VSSLVNSIIATGLLSAPIIGLHHTIPTCRQAAGRSAPTLGIGVGTWTCLHCTRAVTTADAELTPAPRVCLTRTHYQRLNLVSDFY